MNKVPVEDRLDIQALVARYAFLCDTAQYDKLDALFSADGVFDESILGTPVVTGTAALRDIFISAGGTAKFMIHLNSNHLINSYTGTTASGTCHLHVEAELHDGRSLRILGYYADDYIKVAGAWLLKARKLVAIAPITLQ